MKRVLILACVLSIGLLAITGCTSTTGTTTTQPAATTQAQTWPVYIDALTVAVAGRTTGLISDKQYVSASAANALIYALASVQAGAPTAAQQAQITALQSQWSALAPKTAAK